MKALKARKKEGTLGTSKMQIRKVRKKINARRTRKKMRAHKTR